MKFDGDELKRKLEEQIDELAAAEWNASEHRDITEGMEELAFAMSHFFACLCKFGFNEEAALELTECYLSSVVEAKLS